MCLPLGVCPKQGAVISTCCIIQCPAHCIIHCPAHYPAHPELRRDIWLLPSQRQSGSPAAPTCHPHCRVQPCVLYCAASPTGTLSNSAHRVPQSKSRRFACALLCLRERRARPIKGIAHMLQGPLLITRLVRNSNLTQEAAPASCNCTAQHALSQLARKRSSCPQAACKLCMPAAATPPVWGFVKVAPGATHVKCASARQFCVEAHSQPPPPQQLHWR